MPILQPTCSSRFKAQPTVQPLRKLNDSHSFSGHSNNLNLSYTTQCDSNTTKNQPVPSIPIKGQKQNHSLGITIGRNSIDKNNNVQNGNVTNGNNNSRRLSMIMNDEKGWNRNSNGSNNTSRINHSSKNTNTNNNSNNTKLITVITNNTNNTNSNHNSNNNRTVIYTTQINNKINQHNLQVSNKSSSKNQTAANESDRKQTKMSNSQLNNSNNYNNYNRKIQSSNYTTNEQLAQSKLQYSSSDDQQNNNYQVKGLRNYKYPFKASQNKQSNYTQPSLIYNYSSSPAQQLLLQELSILRQYNDYLKAENCELVKGVRGKGGKEGECKGVQWEGGEERNKYHYRGTLEIVQNVVRLDFHNPSQLSIQQNLIRAPKTIIQSKHVKRRALKMKPKRIHKQLLNILMIVRDRKRIINHNKQQLIEVQQTESNQQFKQVVLQDKQTQNLLVETPSTLTTPHPQPQSNQLLLQSQQTILSLLQQLKQEQHNHRLTFKEKVKLERERIRGDKKGGV